jgi:hypothetical protein
MKTRLSLALLFASGLFPLRVAPAEEPTNPQPARIEFRWLENRPIPDVTFMEGIRTTCGEELSYPHATPVLTGADVSEAELLITEFTNGLPSPQFGVHLHLTAEAKQKLADTCPSGARGELAVFVDNQYFGTRYLHSGDIEGFVPMAGFMISRSAAERIVASVQNASAGEAPPP